MINMAVISLKDIIKYFIKIVIVMTIIMLLVKCSSNMKEGIKKSEILSKNSFLTCLDTAIPGIASVNHNEAKKSASLEPLKLALGIELEMISSISKKEDGNVAIANNEENKIVEENSTNNEEVVKAQTGMQTEVQKSNVPEKYTTQYNGVKVKNETNYKLTTELLTPNIEVSKEKVIIYHTHATESYTSSEKYTYKPTGNFRTTDKNYSVIRVGRELTNQLKSYGYQVIHNETLHDYPSYSGSYANSLKTVTKLLEENKGTDIAIDLHRDAIR